MAQGHSTTSNSTGIPRFPRRLEVPDGWFNYKPYGDVIAHTRIIAIKTPLKKEYNNGCPRGDPWILDYQVGVCIEDEFTPQQAVDELQKTKSRKLSAVIDLTYTDKYYSSKMFKELGVTHIKVKCPGRELPSEDVYSRFVSALRECLAATTEDPSSVVAVHCTHGLNRTGYLVCRFLMEEQGLTADVAITSFNEARGHCIERGNYLEHLRRGCPRLLPRPPLPRPSDQAPHPQYKPHPSSHKAPRHTRGHGHINGWCSRKGKSDESANWQGPQGIVGIDDHQTSWHGNIENVDNATISKTRHPANTKRGHAGWHSNKKTGDSANWRPRTPHDGRSQGLYNTFEHWDNWEPGLGYQLGHSVTNGAPFYACDYGQQSKNEPTYSYPYGYGNGAYDTRYHPYSRY